MVRVLDRAGDAMLASLGLDLLAHRREPWAVVSVESNVMTTRLVHTAEAAAAQVAEVLHAEDGGPDSAEIEATVLECLKHAVRPHYLFAVQAQRCAVLRRAPAGTSAAEIAAEVLDCLKQAARRP